MEPHIISPKGLAYIVRQVLSLATSKSIGPSTSSMRSVVLAHLQIGTRYVWVRGWDVKWEIRYAPA